MNKRQKIVQDAFLGNEEAVIRRLKSVYRQSLKDIEAKTKALQDQINTLDALQGMTSDPAELARLKSMEQAKVYQRQYQDALKKQVSSILDSMQVEEFKAVDEYLTKCYEEGFLGTIYDLHGQGIPLIMPMDQEAMVRAVQLDSKISQGLYTRLGEDVALLKKKITAQVSRGISTGMSYAQVAQQLAGYTNIGFNNAVRITRTEGHRIQVQSGMDACYKAKDKGADVVKQWDSTLDKRTRPSHQKVDGEIKELDEKFSNGLMFPGDPAGGAAEVVNCRCALLQRARWALDDEELETLKKRADYFGLDKNDSFADFKKKYLKAADEVKKAGKKSTFVPAKTIQEAEEYAKRFVVDKTWSGDGNVSFKGLSVESANKINETLTELFDQYELPRMSNIQPMNFRAKIWKGSETTPMAYRDLGKGELYFNPKILKNPKSVSKYFQEGKEAFKTCERNIDRFTGKKRELIETYLKAGRSLVAEDCDDGMKAMIQHEIGHLIQNRLIAYDKDVVEIVVQGYKDYAINISGYATKTNGEYIAESFCAFLNGEGDRIDPKLASYFEGLMKNE